MLDIQFLLPPTNFPAVKFILMINVSLHSNDLSLIICFLKDLLLGMTSLCHGKFFFLQLKVHGRIGLKIKKFTELQVKLV